jgi:MFS family permease
VSSVQAAEPERRTVRLIGLLFGFESIMYAAVTPILAHYAHEFGASKRAIGLLAAAYPAGMFLGSLVGGFIVTRAGVRRTTVVGLLVFTAATLPFGFASSIALLSALRLIQGVACGCIWSGGLTWVIAIAPRERRGEVLGSVMAAAIFGVLVGTMVGTLADLNTKVVFVCVGVVAFGLTVWTFLFKEPPRTTLGGAAPLRALASNRRFILGSWVTLLVALAIGATAVLIPLRLSRFGATDVEIGVTFVIAALFGVLVTPWVGRVIDRRGVAALLSVGLAATGLLVAALLLPTDAFPLAVLTVLAVGAPMVAVEMGAMSEIADTVERIGAALAFGAMFINLAYAFGEAVGAPAAATLSEATSDTVPLLLVAAALLLTILPVLLSRLRSV